MPRLAGYSTLGKALFFSLPEGRFEWKSSESECCLSNTLEDEVGRQWWSKASRWGAGRLHSVSNVLLLRTTWQPLIHHPRRRIIEKGLCRADIGEQVANSYFHVFFLFWNTRERGGSLLLFLSQCIFGGGFSGKSARIKERDRRLHDVISIHKSKKINSLLKFVARTT